jgi:ketol-acid reductoisomerase
MAKIYHERQVDKTLLKSRKIAIIGFGNQGHAQALNLRDGGYDVVVGLRPKSRTRDRVKSYGLPVLDVPEAVRVADIIAFMVPDEIQGTLFKKRIEPFLTPGKMLLFAHGFAIHYRQIIPPKNVDVTMISPKGPGHMLRNKYLEKEGVAAFIAVDQDASGRAREIALAYASGIGSTRVGVLETTFREETEADLFGEQAVICGGMTSLMKAGFETLLEAGFQPEVAYFECINELKLTVELVYLGGLSFMRKAISNTAEYGDYLTQEKLVTPETRKAMKKILKEIRDGSFARSWIRENQTGLKFMKKMRAGEKQHPAVKIESWFREKMGWKKRDVRY